MLPSSANFSPQSPPPTTAATAGTQQGSRPRQVRLAATGLGTDLGGQIRSAFGRGGGGPGGWWITVEFDVRLDPHNVVRPDIVGWRRARLPVKPSQPPAELVPDWICEVLSPGNGKHDRRTKKALYARFGVAHDGIVEPELRLLEACTLEPSGLWLNTGTYDETSKARMAPFDAIELDLANVLPPVEPPAASQRAREAVQRPRMRATTARRTPSRSVSRAT